jgi:signal peptidase II
MSPRAKIAAAGKSLVMSPRRAGVAIALVVVFLDQIAKAAVLSRPDEFAVDSRPLAPFLDLTLRWNRGISFSLFAGDDPWGQTTLLLLTLAAITLLTWWLIRSRSGLSGAALGFIIGGAIGNAIDRIVHGAVVDYLDLHAFGRHFFVFNLADAAINVGVVLLIVDLLSHSRAPSVRNHGSPTHRAN